MNDRRRNRVARSVESLEHHHAVGVADVSITEDAQAGGGQGHDHGIVCEQADNRRGKKEEKYADDAEKQHVVKAGAPDGNLRALGLPGAQVLANQRGGSIA